jgi:hypothetical protein
MNAKLTYKQAKQQTEIYLGYVNGKLCRFMLMFDSGSHSYIKVVV